MEIKFFFFLERKLEGKKEKSEKAQNQNKKYKFMNNDDNTRKIRTMSKETTANFINFY